MHRLFFYGLFLLSCVSSMYAADDLRLAELQRLQYESRQLARKQIGLKLQRYVKSQMVGPYLLGCCYLGREVGTLNHLDFGSSNSQIKNHALRGILFSSGMGLGTKMALNSLFPSESGSHYVGVLAGLCFGFGFMSGNFMCYQNSLVGMYHRRKIDQAQVPVAKFGAMINFAQSKFIFPTQKRMQHIAEARAYYCQNKKAIDHGTQHGSLNWRNVPFLSDYLDRSALTIFDPETKQFLKGIALENKKERSRRGFLTKLRHPKLSNDLWGEVVAFVPSDQVPKLLT